MSYDSKVLLTLTDNAVKQFNEQYDKLDDPSFRNPLLTADKHLIDTEFVPAGRINLFIWDWRKWYTEFQDVGFIEKFLKQLDDKEYYYKRIGESFGDEEESGSLLYIGIVYDFDIPPRFVKKE